MNSNGEDSGERAARSSIPTIESSFISVRTTLSSGFGVFADEDLASRTMLLESSSPAAYVISRQFRKEVCAWCFRYERGRTWKVRFCESDLNEVQDGRMAASIEEEEFKVQPDSLKKPRAVSGSFNGGGMVFDSEACKNNWLEQYGAIGLESFAAVEAFVQKQSRTKNGKVKEGLEGDDPKRLPDRTGINKVWDSCEETASIIRECRAFSNNSQMSTSYSQTSPRNSMSQKNRARMVANVLRLPIPNPDLLFFMLSGVLCRYESVVSSCKGETHPPNHWPNLLNLCPSPTPFSSQMALTETTHVYLQLLSIVPTALLEDDQVLSRSTIESILTRDVGNSFGIWSVQDAVSDERAATNNAKIPSEEDPEILGYAIYPTASFFNHSCRPNVHKQRVGRSWIFSVNTPMRANEELTITYIRGEEDTLPLTRRRRRLEEGWGFLCNCPKCVQEEETVPQDNETIISQVLIQTK